MCDLVENYAKACAEKAAREATEKAEKAAKDATESAKKLFESGVSYEVVRNAMPTLKDNVLETLYEEVKSSKK